MKLLRRTQRSRPTRVFFAADVHGSDATFRKFVNAAAFYDADVLVFGGDLTGKATVPVVAHSDGTHRAELHGLPHTLDGADAVSEFVHTVETVGFYWELMDEERYRSLTSDEDSVEKLFVRLARERLTRWLALAQERLAGTRVRMYLTGGNDDMPEILDVLEDVDGQSLVSCDRRVVDLDGRHSMFTVGYSTPTPWATPREVTEDTLAGFIEAGMGEVPDPSRCVLNVHVPPLDSGLDRCLKVDASTEIPTVVKDGGRPVYFGAGSMAVKEALQRYQPMIGLHGHIHESPGQIRYGKTKCFNPGSEYSRGALSGMLLTLKDGELLGYQHTTG